MRAFLEETPTPPSPPPQPNHIDEPVFDTFMESIRDNEPLTYDSSYQPIDISSDTEIESEPEPHPIIDPEENNDFVR